MIPPPARAERRVLVVDDEENMRHMLQVILGRAGYDVLTARDGQEALELLERDPLSIVLCDVRMPRMDGLAFLDGLGRRGQQAHVVMMSAYGSMELALEAMKRGAYDYISKPFKPDEILLTLRKVEEREQLTLENERLRRFVQGEATLEGFVGRSPAIRDILETLRKIAPYPTTVLITGESGTGKELLARGLHALSGRAGPFVAVNCGALPEALLESELFGHERGAFTGAHRARAGLFEEADGGTLLLDELGELPAPLQVKLLRALEEGAARRVGGNRDVAFDVRVIAATARDIDAEVQSGRFREDLYYRLDVVHLRVPPLRARREDIPELIAFFLERFNGRLGKRVRRLSEPAIRILVDAPWPGNVRQLENAIERAVLLCSGDEIRPGDLPGSLQMPRPVEAPPAPQRAEPLQGSVEAPGEELSIKRRTAALERDLIQRALARTGGNRTAAAKLLEISARALRYKIQDYGLESA